MQWHEYIISPNNTPFPKQINLLWDIAIAKYDFKGTKQHDIDAVWRIIDIK